MFGPMPQLSIPVRERVCSLVVTTMMNAATDILDLPEGQRLVEKETAENFVLQLHLIFLGERAWTSPD